MGCHANLRHRNRPHAGAAGLRCAFVLVRDAVCGVGSSRWRAVAAVAFVAYRCRLLPPTLVVVARIIPRRNRVYVKKLTYFLLGQL